MDPDKMTRAMARWWQNMSQRDDDASAANPMLYDPLQGVRITKTRQYLATVIICLSAVAVGTALSWTSPVLPQLTHVNATLFITEEQSTWIASLLAIGALVGAIPFGIMADKIGRKYSAILLGAIYVTSWAITIQSSGPVWFYIARFIIGIATGAACVVVPMYISEYAETSIRGLLGTCFQLFLTIGILLVFVVGAYTSWVTLSIVCGIIPCLFIFGMIFIPESPNWLIKKGRDQDAAVAIHWFWGRHCDAQTALNAIKSDMESSSGSGTLRDLFSIKSNRNGFLISVALMFFQQFSGINAVVFFTNTIFASAGSTLDASVSSIIVGVVQVIATFLSAVLVERAGRKILLLQSSAIMGTCLIILGIYFKLKDGGSDVNDIGWLPLLCLVGFIISFSLGYGPIPWMMMSELLPPEVKGVASSFVVLFNWICVFIVTKSFEPLKNTIGNDFTFWIFAVIMIVGTLFAMKFVFETKGKSSAQIQLMLSGEKLG